jgi:hypothetical protein
MHRRIDNWRNPNVTETMATSPIKATKAYTQKEYRAKFVDRAWQSVDARLWVRTGPCCLQLHSFESGLCRAIIEFLREP